MIYQILIKFLLLVGITNGESIQTPLIEEAKYLPK
jgi:hypothetical protein